MSEEKPVTIDTRRKAILTVFDRDPEPVWFHAWCNFSENSSAIIECLDGDVGFCRADYLRFCEWESIELSSKEVMDG